MILRAQSFELLWTGSRPLAGHWGHASSVSAQASNVCAQASRVCDQASRSWGKAPMVSAQASKIGAWVSRVCAQASGVWGTRLRGFMPRQHFDPVNYGPECVRNTFTV